MNKMILAIAAVAGLAFLSSFDERTSIMFETMPKPQPIMTEWHAHASPSDSSRGCPRFVYGMVPTAAQWNACFDSKQDRIDLVGEPR